MDIDFRNYKPGDYEALCGFLIELNDKDRSHINWNWARLEWMIDHPDFDASLSDSIGLWLNDGRIVGAAIYDMYFGEAFCGALNGFEYLYPEIVKYAWDHLKDENGLGITVWEGNEREKEILTRFGFEETDCAETAMAAELCDIESKPFPDGFTVVELDQKDDVCDIMWILWQGFDHGSDRDEFEKTEEIRPGKRRHFNKYLSVAAKAPSGEYAAFCGLWYQSSTDYTYVEPVCTVPGYRGQGIGLALVTEALIRARSLGAKYAYVITDNAFYEKIGFKKDLRCPFYWKKP